MSRTNRIIGALGLSLLAMTSATAADLKGNASPVANSWDGFYAGATIGGATAGFNVKGPGRFDEDFTDSSFHGGAFAGYNFSSGPWVWGLEADLNAISLDDKPVNVRGLGAVEVEGDFVGSVRGRFGYSFDTLLIYGTAGVAFTDMEFKAASGGKTDFSTGVALGVGAEWAFSPNWTARAEGMVYGFGEESVKIGTVNRDVGAGLATWRLGLAYKF